MTRARFHVTYNIVTHESATQGDVAESGFVTAGNWHNELAPSVCGSDAAAFKAEHALTLREAVSLINTACLHYNGDGSFYEQDERSDYRTGNSETRALHCPDSITGASLARVARLLGATS